MLTKAGTGRAAGGASGSAWLGFGTNIANPSQLITPTGQVMTLPERRLLELQNIWDVGGRFPRIDAETAEADRAISVGFKRWVVIISGSKSMPSVASTTAYLASYPQAWVEPMNEPNIGGSPWTAAAYAAAQISWYAGVKAVYPNAKLLLGSIGNSESTQENFSPREWASALAAAGCTRGAGFDYGNYHVYENPAEFYHWRTPDGSGNSVQSALGNPQYIISEFGDNSTNEATQKEEIRILANYVRADARCVGGQLYAIGDDAEGQSYPDHYGLMDIAGVHKLSWDLFASFCANP